MIRTFRHTESRCPNCNEIINAATSVMQENYRPPRPGDMAVCIDCHHVSIYGKDLKLHHPTDEEMVDIAGDPELVLAIEMLGAYKRRSP